METTIRNNRLRITDSERRVHVNGFAKAVERGLTNRPKSLPNRHFYDRIGSCLFEAICQLPEYYLTRAERQILETYGQELASKLPFGVTLVELGSGSCTKTRILIEEILGQQDKLVFIPIDISRSAIEESSNDLVEAYEYLEVHAIVAEYTDGLRLLRNRGNGGARGRSKTALESADAHLILWLGSSIGNLERDDAVQFIRDIRDEMQPEDRLLIGIDLRKDRITLEDAYDDPSGITAQFNKNLLTRINRELDGEFDLDSFRHRVAYKEESGRVEIFLVSDKAQNVEIQALDLTVSFEADETIHTENCYKYSPEEIDALARATGLRLDGQWFDRKERFSVNLFAVD